MQVKFSKNYSFWIFLALFLVPHLLFWKVEETQSFYVLMSLYSISFLGYLGINSHGLSQRNFLMLFLAVCAPYFLSIPQLSVDFYRFLWDGTLQHQGINPFDLLPPKGLQNLSISDCSSLDIYAGISELSLENYTPYPSINQWYFYLATACGGSLLFQVNLLRILILATLFLGYKASILVLDSMNLNRKFVSYLFLNPLFIIECIGNVHFEGVMITWMLLAMYFILKKKWLFGALFLTLAVQIKLIPLLLTPFVLRYFGWRKTLLFGLITIVSTLLLFALYLDSDNVGNFVQSIRLYFRSFEFNSILLYPYLSYGEIKFGWNLTRVYAPKLAQWSFFLLLSLAFYGGEINRETLVKRWLLASLIYLIFSSTVHPWYWIFPLSLSILYPNKSVLIGCFLTFCSYGLYAHHLGIGNYQAVLSALNFGWLVYAFYEFTRRKKPTYFSFFLRSGTGS